MTGVNIFQPAVLLPYNSDTFGFGDNEGRRLARDRIQPEEIDWKNK